MQAFNRVLLKISGESMCEDGKRPFSKTALACLAEEIVSAVIKFPNLELAIMPGGGNHGRGSELINTLGIKEMIAHHVGMCFTIANAMVLEGILSPLLKQHGVKVRLMTSIKANRFGEEYLPKPGQAHLEKKRVVILAGGSGEAFKSTDDATMVKAGELECDAVLKGTKVDGVYSADPKKDAGAKFIPKMTAQEFLERGLSQIFDLDGVAKGKGLKKPIHIFNMFKPGNLVAVLSGEAVGTVITPS